MKNKDDNFDFDEWTNLGNILIRRNAITRRQLERALKFQDSTGEKLGRVIVSLGFCSRDEVEAACAEQTSLRMPKISSDVFGAAEAAFARLETQTERLVERRSRSDSRRFKVIAISPDTGE